MSSHLKTLDALRDVVARSGVSPIGGIPQEWEPEPNLRVRVGPLADGWRWEVCVLPEHQSGSVTVTCVSGAVSVAAEGAVLPRHLERALRFVSLSADDVDGYEAALEHCKVQGPRELLKQVITVELAESAKANDVLAESALQELEASLSLSGRRRRP